MKRRAATEGFGDFALAGLLAITPLLPYAPRYLGWFDVSAVEIALPALLVIWMCSVVSSRGMGGGDPGSADPGGSAQLTRGWILFLIPVSGAFLVGLASDNRLSSAVFVEQLRSLSWERAVDMNALTDPLYSGRVGLTFAEGFLAFWLVGRICAAAGDPHRRARRALSGWMAGFAVVSLLGIGQYVTRFQLHPYWVRVNPNLVRAHATLDDPNSLAAYLLLGLGVGLGAVWTAALRGPRRWAWYAIVSCGLAALIATMSRVAWVALAAMLVIAVAVRPSAIAWIPADRRRQWSGVARVVALVGVSAGMAALVLKATVPAPQTDTYAPRGPIETILQTFDPRVPLEESLSQRTGWWSTALRMGAYWPLTGAGLGRYPRLVEEFRPQGSTVVPENAHNFFLQVLAECGTLGAAGLGALIVGIVWPLWRRTRESRQAARAAALGSAVGVGAYLLTFSGAHAFLLPSHQILFGSLLAAWHASTPAFEKRSAGSGDEVTRDDLRRSGAFHRVGQLRHMWPVVLGTMALVCSAAYLARAARTPPPPQSNAPWGYSAGLHAIEGARTRRPFRWTSDVAILDVRPADHVRSIELTFAVARPVEAGDPVETRILYGAGAPVEKRFTNAAPGRRSLEIAVDPRYLDDDGILPIRIEVTPIFVPALDGESNDWRRLGVRLWAIRYIE